MSLTLKQIDETVERYWREIDRYVKLSEYVAEKCRQEVIQDNAIRAAVSWRAKSRKSLHDKLQLWMTLPDKADINSVEGVFSEIKDLAGVRVSTYVEEDREIVVQTIQRKFDGPDEGRVSIEKHDATDSFYRATHCQVTVKSDELVGRYENLAGLSCEVQVTSLLAHVWNEIEHDLNYKPTTGRLSDIEQNLIQQLGHLTKAGDITVIELYHATDKRLKEYEGSYKDVYDFVARTQSLFPSAKQFGTNAGQLLLALEKMRWNSPKLVQEKVISRHKKDYEMIAKDLLEKFKTYLSGREEDFYLNEKSSDLLMILLLESSADEILDAFPAGYGQGRPARIRSLAYRYKAMPKGKTTQ